MDQGSEQSLILTDKVGDAGHVMDEGWIRSRVRGWMETIESPNMDYWIGTYNAEGKWIYGSSNGNLFAPRHYKQSYAMRVCLFLNRQASYGGVWLAGWIRGGVEFYLLWKDEDGDIKCPIECSAPYSALERGWTPEVWEKHAHSAIGVVKGFDENMEHGRGQKVKLAQGEKISSKHLQEAAKYVPLDV